MNGSPTTTAAARPLPTAPRLRLPALYPRLRGRQPAPLALVVDSDADARCIATSALALAGYRTLAGHSGEEGIRLALEQRPHLILTELRLHGVDGVRAIEVLRDDPRTASVPILVVTTHADPQTQARARAAGCSAYLVKPCPPRRLLEAAALLRATPR